VPPVPYGVGATGYNKCVTVKLCFGYRKYDSVTFALLETKCHRLRQYYTMRVMCFVLNGLIAVTD